MAVNFMRAKFRSFRNVKNPNPKRSLFILKKTGLTQNIITLDLTSENSIKNAADEIKTRFPDLEILINNAGIGHRGSCQETSIEVTKKIMETNFYGPIHLTKCKYLIKSTFRNFYL